LFTEAIRPEVSQGQLMTAPSPSGFLVLPSIRLPQKPKGYMPRTIIVDPKEAVGNIIKRNIELTSLNSTIVLDHLIFELG
jgi:hypothetical protein